MTIEAFLSLVDNVGLAVALVAVFMWQNARREKNDKQEKQHLIELVAQVEDYQRTVLTQLSGDSIKAINLSTEATKRTCDVLQRVCEALERRPCIAGDIKGVT